LIPFLKTERRYFPLEHDRETEVVGIVFSCDNGSGKWRSLKA
jgi:hypothetical protein